MGRTKTNEDQAELGLDEVVPDRDGDEGKSEDEKRGKCLHIWKTVEEGILKDGAPHKRMQCASCGEEILAGKIERLPDPHLLEREHALKMIEREGRFVSRFERGGGKLTRSHAKPYAGPARLGPVTKGSK